MVRIVKKQMFRVSVIFIALIVLSVTLIHEYFGLLFLTHIQSVWIFSVEVVQLILEGVIFMHMFFLFYSLSYSKLNGEADYILGEVTDYFDFDVIVPTRYVNPVILETTLKALISTDYPAAKLHIYVADDTSDENLSKAYNHICSKYQINYFYKPENVDYKAGILNLLLPYLQSEHFAIFDYDHVPDNQVFKTFAYAFVNNPDAGFVQAKKRFHNLHRISHKWSALIYSQLFEIMEPAKDQLKTVLFAGSTACFRKSAVELVGGFPQSTFTEDTAITIEMLQHKIYGKFINYYGSTGDVPTTYDVQIAQLWRWSHGASHLFSLYFKKILFSKNISWKQKFDLYSTLGITPILVTTYLFSLTFVPLLALGIDSTRWMIGDINSLIFIPIFAILSYLILLVLSLYRVKVNGMNEFNYRDVVMLTILAISSNVLIFSAGFTGVLRLLGPKSSRGRWNRKIPILRNSMIAFVFGAALIAYGIIAFLNHYYSSILIILIGISFLPSLFVTIASKFKIV